MILWPTMFTDGGYESPHNKEITWKNHRQQESEWEGEMWGKNANFLGEEEFGNGQRKPRGVNHKVANQGTGANPARGRILFQSEGAEVWFRNMELRPLSK